MQIDPSREFERLRCVEYGDPTEFLVRVVAVILGSFLLFSFTGWWSAFAWSGLFGAIHLISYVFFHRERAVVTVHHVIIGCILFVAVFAAFVWMPVVMAIHENKGISFTGSTLLASLLLFVVRRSDTMVWMAAAQVAMLAVGFGVICWHVLGQIDDWMVKLGVVTVALAVVGYLSLAVLTTRRLRLQVELQERRSAQEQKMAAIGQLAGGIAHDFNNMLTVILGNLELSRAVSDPVESAKMLDEAEAAARRAEAVIRQLLIYTQRSGGLPQLQDTNHAVQRIMALAERLAAKDTTITLALSDRELPIKIDGAQLLTALVNLVANAVDALNGAGAIRISTDRRDLPHGAEAADGALVPPGAYAAIQVDDTGGGIARDMLRKVIEPFFTTKPRSQGTGLGLPMVLGFASENGGGLLLKNGRDGVCATILLPLVLPDDMKPQFAADAAPATNTPFALLD